MTLIWKAKATAEGTEESELSRYMKALGHPARLRLVRTLMLHGPSTCGDLVGGLDLAQSTVSEHLRILRASDIVEVRDDGVRRIYAVRRDTLRRMRTLIGEFGP